MYDRKYAFERIREEFEGKYGPPHNVEKIEVLTNLGARFPKLILSWRWPDGTEARLEQHATEINQAYATVETKAYVDEMASRDRLRKREVGKDL